MPRVLFTTPEVAVIGNTEAELKAADRSYKVGRASFAANPRAQIHRQTTGFLKLIVDDRTNLILGAHLIGPGAAELISRDRGRHGGLDDLRGPRPNLLRASDIVGGAAAGGMAAGGWHMQG